MANWTFRDTILGSDVVVDDATTLLGPYLSGGRYQVKIAPSTTLPATTAAAGANNGTSPPAPVVTAGSTDKRGNITFGSGTTPAVGAQVVVTFGSTQPSYGSIDVQARNTLTQALGLWCQPSTTGGFTLGTTVAPASAQANTVYSFDYTFIP